MSTDKTTIDAYNAVANRWSRERRNGDNFFHSYLEKPAMFAKLPKMAGRNVLSVGCGSGEECEEIKELGAREVVGIDVSAKLVEIARNSFSGIEFRVLDVESMEYSERFDYVYSSLCFHYLPRWGKALHAVYEALRPGGTFLFSIEHPIMTARERIFKEGGVDKLFGVRTKRGQPIEVIGDYFETSRRSQEWAGEIFVYYHHPISLIISEVIGAGFEISGCSEPAPQDAVRHINRDFWDVYSRLPLFMIWELRKPTHD